MNISKPVVDALDWVGHQLTAIPLWLQAPTVIAVVVLLCAYSAFVLLRAIDILGARAYPLFRSEKYQAQPQKISVKDE